MRLVAMLLPPRKVCRREADKLSQIRGPRPDTCSYRSGIRHLDDSRSRIPRCEIFDFHAI